MASRGSFMEQWYYLLRSQLYNLDLTTQEWVYRSFYRFVYKDVFFMTHDRSLTEDIIQEAFIKASTQGPKLRNNTNVPGWIKLVARNTTIDWLRKMKKDRYTFNAANFTIDEVAPNEVSVASEVEIKIRNELLHTALTELNDDYRIILLLFYVEGKSYKEICHELRLTEPVLTQRLARARKKLLQHFLRKWADFDE